MSTLRISPRLTSAGRLTVISRDASGHPATTNMVSSVTGEIEVPSDSQAQHILISSKSPGAAVQRFPQAGEFHIYLDSVSLIPLKAVYFTLSTRNTAPLYRIEDLYSDYRQVGSILVPFTVERSLNGHPYARFSLQSVNTNASLSEDDFLLR